MLWGYLLLKSEFSAGFAGGGKGIMFPIFAAIWRGELVISDSLPRKFLEVELKAEVHLIFISAPPPTS